MKKNALFVKIPSYNSLFRHKTRGNYTKKCFQFLLNDVFLSIIFFGFFNNPLLKINKENYVMKRSLLMLIIFSVSAALFAGGKGKSGQSSGGKKFATIGTGGVTGVYYPTGGAISKMVNKKSEEYGIKVTVESTAGSVFNTNALISGDIEFGVVQSDVQYNAYNGKAQWEGKPQEDLRAVFSIHPEMVTIMAADDSEIYSIADMAGRTINIGAPGTGNRTNAVQTLEAILGSDWQGQLRVEELKPAESAKLLQDNRIDAYFYTVGHPNGSFQEASSGTRKTHFVPIDETFVDGLVAEYSYYVKTAIPVAEYPNATNTEDPVTYGVKATLCSSASVDEAIVYAVVKEVFENIEEFKTLHPAYKILTPESMLEGLSAPLHPGALKYFKESGLI